MEEEEKGCSLRALTTTPNSDELIQWRGEQKPVFALRGRREREKEDHGGIYTVQEGRSVCGKGKTERRFGLKSKAIEKEKKGRGK